jgi:ribosomal protein L16 Arg81 hydroxylase
MAELPTETRLSTEWELWVVEQLLFTAKRDDLAAVLVAEGLDPAVARAQVARIEANPGFSRLRDRLGEARLAERLERMREKLVVDAPIAVRETITPSELRDQHWIPSRPVKLTRIARDIPAVRTWTLRGLAERFKTATVEVNVDRSRAKKPSETEDHRTRMPIPAFVDRALTAHGNDLYVVSRNGWLADPQFLALWADLRPLPDILVPTDPPRGVSLWVGPAGTVTPPHFDPHNVLLVQVQGTKRVRLAPRVRASQHALLDGYYLNGSLDAAFGERVLSLELAAGEALFVPMGWFHEVTALEPSITLSFLAFPWPNHFHGLGPTGSDDAR